MSRHTLQSISSQKQTAVFCAGLAAILLAFLLPFPSAWNTFMLGWRVEVIAAVLLLSGCILSYLAASPLPIFGPTERRFILIPLIAFVGWSALSVLWAGSPSSAVQHTLTWALFLIAYILTRQILENRGSASFITRTFILCLAFYGILALIAQLTLAFVGTSTQIGVIYSKFGEQAITILPLAIIGVLNSSGRRFNFGVAGITSLWLLVFCSSSRTANGLFLAGLLAIGALTFTLRSWKKFRLKFAIVCLPIFLLPIALVGVSTLAESDEGLVFSRVQDQSHIQGSNDFRRLMYSLGWGMFKSNPQTGVGAGNFGWEVNKYRAAHSIAKPDDPLLAQAETSVPERAHNEYLQIAAELGVVGIAAFAWFLIGVAVLGSRALKKTSTTPPQAVASVIGLGLFLASSFVTSYSFRLPQNGITFFVVLAIAARMLFRESSADPKPASPLPAPFVLATAAACLALVSLCAIRVASAHFVSRGNSTADLASAEAEYRQATKLDSSNPDAPYALGRRLIEAGRYSEAIPLLRRSIDIGRASSTDYSYLATAQSLSGDNAGAETTFAEAARMYPRSPFVLARYSVLLESNGKGAEAAEQFQRAVAIDPKAANGWKALIANGSKYASDMALKRDDHTPVMDLKPYDSIYAIVEERDIRFPDERVKLPFERLR